MLRLASVLCLLPGLLWAQALMSPFSDQERAGWQAVGRVNIAGYNRRGMCTGTLIAPDKVLTAAHCLFRASGRPAQLADLRFVAGWHKGAATGVAGVVRAHLHPKALHEGRIVPRSDLAVLVLDQTLDVAPLPVAAGAPPSAIVGYEASRPHLLGGRFDCVLYTEPGSGPALRCPVERGASGGPVLAQGPDGWVVVGVVSARKGTDTLFAPVGDWVAAHVPRAQ